MALNFPDTTGQPTDGSFTYEYSGKTYSWNGSYWALQNTIPIGYTGSRGIGFTGSQGITGFVGSRGTDGIIGIDGYTGSQGLQGPIGYTGSRGIQGPIGYTGSGFASNEAIFTGSIQEQTFALTDSATIAIDPANGTIQYLTALGASRTIDTSAFVDGEAVTLMINDNSGTGSVTTWSTVEWVNNGGTAPTLATTGYTVVSIWKVGSTLYGALVGDGS